MGKLTFFNHSGTCLVFVESHKMNEIEKDVTKTIASGQGFTLETDTGTWAFPEEFVRNTYAFIEKDEEVTA